MFNHSHEAVVAEETLDKELALGEILAIRDQVAALGANDSEIPVLNDIHEQLLLNLISSEEALRRARLIENIKQDYH